MSAQCVRVRMKLEEIAIGNNLTGVEPTLVVSVVAVVPIPEFFNSTMLHENNLVCHVEG